MWEPGDGDTTSSNSNGAAASRGLLLLTAVLGACLLLYKAWGPLLLITCALVLVVHTCYSLLVNDSLLAPHTLVLLRYARQIALELLQTLRLLSVIGIKKGKELARYLKEYWEERQRRTSFIASVVANEEEDMNGRHRNVYRLSTTGTDLAEQVSPISSNRYHFALNGARNVVRTSTPLPKGETWQHDGQPNGQIGLFKSVHDVANKKVPAMRSENRQPNALGLSRDDETMYSPKGSPWGNSISPRMSEKGSGVRAVQTVAGPLLASTRYNIDPKVYTDVSSPGLTSRLTKYASEASNKLTHQSQYGTGQFPKVNLNALPTPLLSPKVARARIPVTVRVAPPEMINYAPSDSQIASTSQEKHKMFPSTSTSDQPKETKSCPSVAQVLKEISLKRHASREDIMLDLAKKQRTERIGEDQLENLEEMMQKRAREESITSEDDLSPQSKISERPLKRPKASSCHDILNSLSSSINVFSGVKRKAMDTSRCNTPDIEKHFKPSTTSPNRSNSFTGQTSVEIARSKEELNVKVPIANAAGEPYKQKVSEKSPETAKDKEHSYEKLPATQEAVKDFQLPPTPRIPKERPVPPKAEKLTDKLFMRAEPKVRENLKNYIDEQESIESKFITDDKDEIKKQDIVNMRQNKLKSMFEAISGKSTNKIDPDVVIHAEEIIPSSSSGYTSLSSGTTTTTVNTSPITTTIVPILKTDNEAKSPNTKHVTFNLPKSTSSLGSGFSSTTSNIQSLSSLTNKNTSKPAVESKPPSTGVPSFGGFSSNSTTSSSVNFNFGSNASSTSTSSSFKPTAPQSTASGFSFSTNTAATSTSADTKSATITTTTASAGINPSLFAPKSTSQGFNPSTAASSSGFSFASSAKTTPTTAVGSSIAPSAFGSNAATSAPSIAQTTAATSGGFSFGSSLAKSPTSTSLAQPKTTTTTTTLPTFGSDKKESTGFSFGAPTPANSTAASTTATNQPPSTFGSTTSTSSPMFSAGNPSAAVSSAAPPSSTTPMFNFNSGGNKPATDGFSFGGAATATAATAAPANTTTSAFRPPAQTQASSVVSTFAPPISSSAMGSPAVIAPKPSFGTSTPSSLFGAPSSTPSLFSTASASNAASMFKSPTSSTMAGTTTPATSSIFGAPSASPAFGTPSTTAATPTSSLFGNNPAPATTSTPTLFGNNPATAAATTTSTPSLFGNNPTTTSSIPSLFSNVAAIATSSTVSPFGTAAQQHQQPQQQSSIFSGGNTSTAAPATSSIFGSTAAGPAPGGLFSGAISSGTNMAPAASSSNTPTGIFGQTQQPASLSFGSATSAFGAPTASPGFGTPSSNTPGTSAFGAAPSTIGGLPSFSTLKSTPQFGAPTASGAASTSGTGSSIFGSASGGSFGAPTTGSAPTFGSTPASTSGFGAPSVNAAPSFGTTNPPTFGSTTSSPFGAQTTTAATPSLFGSAAPAPSGAPSTGASFSFGGAQQQAQQPQQQQQQQQQSQQPAASFGFGGAAPAAPATSSSIFQFGGASTAPKPAGFNFNAPAAAPQMNFTGAAPGAIAPAFNAPAANMFSIGSGGSSTPRPRLSRTRRQR